MADEMGCARLAAVQCELLSKNADLNGLSHIKPGRLVDRMPEAAQISARQRARPGMHEWPAVVIKHARHSVNRHNLGVGYHLNEALLIA